MTTDADPADPTGGNSGDSRNRADEFGWHGWLLVAVLVFGLIVVPWAILLLPSAQGLLGSLGLGLRDAYLVLPMVPALLLGAAAVWTAVKNRERR